MCNLYSMTRTQDELAHLFEAIGPADRLGNLASLEEVYPDAAAPILRQGDGPELALARWGMPTPPQFLKGKRTDRGVTNVRNPGSPHWRRWLGPESRCLVPFTRFAEPHYATKATHWFTLADGGLGMFRRDLDPALAVGPQAEGRRDGGRSLRLPDHRGECRGGARSTPRRCR